MGYKPTFRKSRQNVRGVTCDGLASHPGEISDTPRIASCYGNWDELSWMGHFGLGVDF